MFSLKYKNLNTMEPVGKNPKLEKYLNFHI